jgi:thiol:disulfide interchange protein DsbD
MARSRDLLPRRGGGLAAMLLVLAAAGAVSARAGEPEAKPAPPPPPQAEVKSPPENNVTYRARLDPPQPLAGAKGTLIVDLTIRKSVHVYADKKFKVLPVEAKGLTWSKPEVPPPVKWVDPNLGGDPEEVWFDKATVKIPFELAADAVFPLTIASNFKQSCCDEGTCYPADLTKAPVGFTLTASGVVAPDPVSKDGAKKDGSQTPPAMSDAAPTDPAPAPGNPPAPGANPPAPKGPPVPKEPPPEPAEPPAEPMQAAVAADTAPQSTSSAAEFEGSGAHLTVSATATEVVVVAKPLGEKHLYPPGTDEKTVDIAGAPGSSVTLQPTTYPPTAEAHITEPYTVRAAYEGKPSADAPARFTVTWQSCDEKNCFIGGENFKFDGAHVVHVPKEMPAPPSPDGPAPTAPGVGATAGAIPATGLLFPTVGQAQEVSEFEAMWKKWGIGVLGILFALGVGLAFTPCVLPIIPITVSIIGGGSGNVSRGRMTLLLSCYVLGLSLAFATMGVVSAKTGSAMSAAFQSPTAIWIIAGVFFVLSLGMFGIYELQPPQWMQRLQGGAKGGNVIGAFLFGAMAAVIASPCTGPLIVGLVVFTAQTGSALLGFVLFFALGLGMGAVFFAAGSLNLVMRPGPWMVWVRYAFGIILVGAALYYLAHSGRLVPPLLFVVGFAIALGVGAAIVHHLVKRQGEEVGTAGSKAARIAVLLCAATGLVAWITKEPTYVGSGKPLEWASVTTRDELVAEVEKAKKEGKSTLFDIRANWCAACNAYEKLMNDHDELHARLEKVHLVHLDNSEVVPGEPGVRDGLGVKSQGQPMLVFIDAKGRLHRDLTIDEFKKDEAAGRLKKALDSVQKPDAP